ncbi:MAG: tRNA (guanosine(37)-N1)-methyltransferase TrmD [Myxococcales bacterium]|nr:tRNA (guanosine(37)-N1)-methyltransferase TrmD [Myxococcota bacterium]MDW8281664.1 tRNA (guanosine(37)-N1)-methyltransferase TrmD [Myxococcales bacterium]
MFSPVLSVSMTGRAQQRGCLVVHLTNVRDHAPGRHRSTDDTPYGGGSGMVMRAEPLIAALEAIESARGRGHRVLLTPAGTLLTQALVRELARRPHLVLVCGRYEGVDERVSAYVDQEISIGDYVLSGGELAAMVIVDAVARLQPGVLHNEQSAAQESFEHGLLEYPQYTRPAVFRGADVPEVLLSGNHERIRRWRRQQALVRTRARRPDLFRQLVLSSEDEQLLREHDQRPQATTGEMEGTR